MKYLGAVIDSKLKFDEEVENIIHRMACGIKVSSKLGKSWPEKTKNTLLNVILISHVINPL